MKALVLVLGFMMISDLGAQDDVLIDLGVADLKLTVPGKRSKHAPDLSVKQRDVLSWVNSEKSGKHNSSVEFLRKLWDFKRPFRHVSGSLRLTVSIAHNVDFKGDFDQYLNWVMKNRGDYVSGQPVQDFVEQVNINGTDWVKYHSEDGDSLYLRKDLGDDLVLRINIIYSDYREGQNQAWDEKALRLADQILGGLTLTEPDEEKVLP